jgi:hypothetical protein
MVGFLSVVFRFELADVARSSVVVTQTIALLGPTKCA